MRLFWNSFLLSVPAVLLVVAGVFFLRDTVPVLQSNERRRVTQEYRALAIEAKEDGRGIPFDFAASGLKRGSLTDRREPWGFDGDIVWYVKNGRAYRLVVTPVEAFDFTRVFYPSVILVLLTVVGTTLFGIRYFWKFVKSRDDFLAATAHDLTTPLVGLRMMIGRDDEEARRLNERLLLIVGNIKDFLRLGGRKTPTPASFDVSALCHEAYSLFAADYEDSESGAVRFETEPAVVWADETMTLQILWNLFGNDLKYAAPYGPVTVRTSCADDRVHLEFVDEGQGMTPRQMRRAFDRYYRARNILESGKGGFGIGLCTARDFARSMGGDLAVRANAPKGCVFDLTLPAC